MDKFDFNSYWISDWIYSWSKKDSNYNYRQAVADKLNLKVSSDIIKQLQWLGLFDDGLIPFSKGTNGDVLLGLMQDKMAYKDHEKDMIIIHNEAIVEFENRIEKRMATMKVEGRLFGHSAMARAVSLPAAIASRMILEGTIRSKGVLKPITEEIYNDRQKNQNILTKYQQKSIALFY